MSTVMASRSAPPACNLQSDEWSWFSDFWFDQRRAEIRPADAEKIDDLIEVLRRQPRRCVAIDGSTRDRGADVGQQRIANLRDALLRAGIAAERIVAGNLDQPGLRHAERVEVLIGPA